MGELDEKVFKEACKLRYPPEEVEIKALELCSLWQEKLKNPEWHPFRVVEDGKGNAQVNLKDFTQFPYHSRHFIPYTLNFQGAHDTKCLQYSMLSFQYNLLPSLELSQILQLSIILVLDAERAEGGR